eukprot:5132327-Pyramimonas_sp.AAC.1
MVDWYLARTVLINGELASLLVLLPVHVVDRILEVVFGSVLVLVRLPQTYLTVVDAVVGFVPLCWSTVTCRRMSLSTVLLSKTG